MIGKVRNFGPEGDGDQGCLKCAAVSLESREASSPLLEMHSVEVMSDVDIFVYRDRGAEGKSL